MESVWLENAVKVGRELEEGLVADIDARFWFKDISETQIKEQLNARRNFSWDFGLVGECSEWVELDVIYL